jgi:hypothetical protein
VKPITVLLCVGYNSDTRNLKFLDSLKKEMCAYFLTQRTSRSVTVRKYTITNRYDTSSGIKDALFANLTRR